MLDLQNRFDSVMAGLDPAISLRDTLRPPKRDARVKPAHDGSECLANIRNHRTV
jgi:hypothetical protein